MLPGERLMGMRRVPGLPVCTFNNKQIIYSQRSHADNSILKHMLAARLGRCDCWPARRCKSYSHVTWLLSKSVPQKYIAFQLGGCGRGSFSI